MKKPETLGELLPEVFDHPVPGKPKKKQNDTVEAAPGEVSAILYDVRRRQPAPNLDDHSKEEAGR